jgi:hypothetical protein
MTILEQDLFVRAGQALGSVIDQIDTDQWELVAKGGPMTAGRTVRQTVASHITEDRWVGHELSGATFEKGKELFGGQPVDGDLAALWREANKAAVESGLALEQPARPVHLSFGAFGDFTATWDLARLLGVEDTLPADLVEGMSRMLAPVAEQWRAWGVYGPAVQVPNGASPQRKLLALTGRAS